MKKYIGYFDYLGFKQFVENNDTSYQTKVMNHIFRDIESALGEGKFIPSPRGVVSDMSESTLQCTNFSDTVVFSTQDDSIESLHSLLRATYRFNWFSIFYNFPVRGAIVHGDIIHVDFRHSSKVGGNYNINSLYGRGMVDAYSKAESQHWAGTVIDQSVVKIINEMGIDEADILLLYAKKYKIPYKSGISVPEEEYAFRLVEGNLNEESFKNFCNNIISNFADHKKDISHPSVAAKIENTINYLSTFK